METTKQQLRNIGLNALNIMSESRSIEFWVDVRFSLSKATHPLSTGYSFSITIFGHEGKNCTFYFYENNGIEKEMDKAVEVVNLIKQGDFKKIYAYSKELQ